MFDILDKENPGLDELATGYANLQNVKGRLGIEKQKTEADVIKLQQKVMAGQDVGDGLRKSKDALSDIDCQIVAVDRGLNDLLAKIETAIPRKRKERVAEIDNETAVMKEQKAMGMRDVLDKYAEVFCLDAVVRGHNIDHPELVLDRVTLLGDLWDYFREAVRRTADRQGYLPKTSLDHKLSLLEAERQQLQYIITMGNSADEDVRKLLNIPPEPDEG
jgi:hypothetical protein